MADERARSMSLQRVALAAVAGAVLIALGAQVTVPAEPVPVTLQTLGVLLAGGFGGARAGGLAALLYVGAAAGGAPVLAEGKALDLAAWREVKSLGYLAGFAPAAVIAALARGRGVVAGLLAMALAHAVVLALGAAWLTRWLAPAEALERGVVPYLGGALAKGLVAAVLVRALVRRPAVPIAPSIREHRAQR